jgi:ABC-type multidrug transport system fused ATPase/permease subunit
LLDCRVGFGREAAGRRAATASGIDTYHWPALRAITPLLAAALALSLIVQLLGLVFPFGLQRIVDAVGREPIREVILPLVGALALAGVTQLGLTALRGSLLTVAQLRWERRFFGEVFRHYLSLPPPTIESYTKEDFLVRLQTNLVMRQVFSPGFVQLALDVVLVVVYQAVLFSYHWSLGVIALVAMVLVGGLTVAVAPRLRAANDRLFYDEVRTAGSERASSDRPRLRDRGALGLSSRALQAPTPTAALHWASGLRRHARAPTLRRPVAHAAGPSGAVSPLNS